MEGAGGVREATVASVSAIALCGTVFMELVPTRRGWAVVGSECRGGLGEGVNDVLARRKGGKGSSCMRERRRKR